MMNSLLTRLHRLGLDIIISYRDMVILNISWGGQLIWARDALWDTQWNSIKYKVIMTPMCNFVWKFSDFFRYFFFDGVIKIFIMQKTRYFSSFSKKVLLESLRARIKLNFNIYVVFWLYTHFVVIYNIRVIF